MSSFSVFDSIYQLVAISIFLIVPIILIVLVVKLVRRNEKRADERLQLERENQALQNQQMQALTDLNQRLIKVEQILEEV